MTRLMRLAVLMALLPPALVLAESEPERRAREDLEAQLRSLVGTPPTKVRVDLIGLDQPNYELIEATFELDGQPLPVGDLRTLGFDGEHLIFHGDVKPGDHRLEYMLHFQNRATQMISPEGGFKWKVGNVVTFRAAAGIEVQLKVTPELDLSAEIKKRIKVTTPAVPKMLAKLDDGTMPEPVASTPKALLEADAGTKGGKGQAAAEKASAAEAKKKEREEAQAAKQAAAEEKQRLAEEAKARRVAAIAEKKQQEQDAQAARKAAAVEALAKRKEAAEEALARKKEAAEDALAKKKAAAEPHPGQWVANGTAKSPGVGPLQVEGDAGAPAEADGGPAAVAVAPAAVPAQPRIAEADPDSSGLSMLIPVGIGVAALGLVLFWLARRRSRPPTEF